jgi:hypothetical protein
MAKYILFECGTGYCGCDFEDVMFYPDDTHEDTIDIDCWGMAEDNAQNYAYCHFGGEDYTDEEWNEYIENYVCCDWREITRAEYIAWCKDWNYTPATEEQVAKETGEDKYVCR